ncbi:uncharacterized protein TNCT_711441 [Trichonephila clavata]|uniref:Uncharacterized protein n=1 Tax=Trichonephila clavata TaxID=2740835 RepID=A0A8X6LB41_TRICU|nr:uncharacterized protein TNCT_711441 [Trichonephila clavata]
MNHNSILKTTWPLSFTTTSSTHPHALEEPKDLLHHDLAAEPDSEPGALEVEAEPLHEEADHEAYGDSAEEEEEPQLALDSQVKFQPALPEGKAVTYEYRHFGNASPLLARSDLKAQASAIEKKAVVAA